MKSPRLLKVLMITDLLINAKMKNIGLLMMAGFKTTKNLDTGNYCWVTIKNTLESLKMIWFMEEASFIKWMELSSKDCGKIINWFQNFEQFFS